MNFFRPWICIKNGFLEPKRFLGVNLSDISGRQIECHPKRDYLAESRGFPPPPRLLSINRQTKVAQAWRNESLPSSRNCSHLLRWRLVARPTFETNQRTLIPAHCWRATSRSSARGFRSGRVETSGASRFRTVVGRVTIADERTRALASNPKVGAAAYRRKASRTVTFFKPQSPET